MKLEFSYKSCRSLNGSWFFTTAREEYNPAVNAPKIMRHISSKVMSKALWDDWLGEIKDPKSVEIHEIQN